MARIVRADPGWAASLAELVRATPRPIPTDARFYPRDRDGNTSRSRYDRATFPPARPAATLVVVYPDPAGRLVVPLTVRRAELRAHAGEVSLPGGAVDAIDDGPEAAAVREAAEEIGLDPASVVIAGRLDPVWIPVTNFELTPIVATAEARPRLVPQPSEVAAIVELPLDALHDEEVIGVETFTVRGVTLRAGAFRYGGVRVWGATALTLAMLAHVLEAEPPDLSAETAPSS